MTPEMQTLAFLLSVGISPFVAVGIVRWWFSGAKLSDREKETAIREMEDKLL